MKTVESSFLSHGFEHSRYGLCKYQQQGALYNFFGKSERSYSCSKLLVLQILLIIIFPLIGYTQQPKQTRSEEITNLIKKQSLVMAKRASDWAKDKTGDILLNGVKEFIKKNKLDQNTAGKILTSVANNKENLQQIYEGASTSDVQAAALSTQLLIGKIIGENLPESNMSTMLKALTKYPDVAAEASQAMGSLAGGDYYKSAETIGKIIWKQTAIGKGIDKAISIEKVGWDFLTQQQFDAAFQKYKENGSEGLIRMYSGPAAYVREKYFQGKSVSDDVINAKMVQLFEAARKEEAAAQNEQVKLEHMYDMFKRMEMEGGLIFDFRKHQEQFGISKETDVFDRFLWLNRAIRRDLLSTGVDPWELGNTLNSDNPTFSPEALALFMAFSNGGTSAYKVKFEEIARLHFRNLEEEESIEIMTFHFSLSGIDSLYKSFTYFPDGKFKNAIDKSEDGADLLLYLDTVKVKKKGLDFGAKVEVKKFTDGMAFATGPCEIIISGKFSKGLESIEELKIAYSFWGKSFSDSTDDAGGQGRKKEKDEGLEKWNFSTRKIPFNYSGQLLFNYHLELGQDDPLPIIPSITDLSFLETRSYEYKLKDGYTERIAYRENNFKLKSYDIDINLFKSATLPGNILPKTKKSESK